MTEHEELTRNSCVSKVPIFNHLNTVEMKEILKTVRHQNYQRNEIVYHQGDLNRHLYIVSKGKLKIVQNHPSGKEQLIRILHQGDFFGELSIFQETELDYEAVAMEEAELCMLNKRETQEFLLKYPKIAIKFLEEISNRLTHAEQMLTSLSTESVGARLARYLMTQSKRSKQDVFSLGMSKKELATYLGTSPETISRRLSAFIEQEIIEEVDYKHLKILDEVLLLKQ